MKILMLIAGLMLVAGVILGDVILAGLTAASMAFAGAALLSVRGSSHQSPQA